MRVPFNLILCYLVAGTAALVDLPEVSKVVTSALKSLHIDTAYHAPTIAPSRSITSLASATAVPKTHGNQTVYANQSTNAAVADSPYWLANIRHQGIAAFNSNPSGYVVFRNVKDYGAAGDGVTDDTAAINSAIASGGRCAPGSCQSSTVTPAIVYFPAGTYVISSSIVDYYFTQLIGNPNALPVIKATPGFVGLGLIDGDPYQSNGNQGYISTGVFYRQVRNIILDLTAIPATTAATGIHWPVGQATSIQNVAIRMTAASNSQQQGIFIENGSGGFLADITITGGLYGANVGNQQFTTRNLRVSNAVVGISQIWSWGWQYQGITITDCTTAFSMTSGGSASQQVGSINIVDSTISGCSVFVDTAWTTNSSPPSAGSLILENVVLNNVGTAVRGPSGTYLAGTTGSTTITAWGQGHQYTPNGPSTFQGSFTPVSRPGSLLAAGSSNWYTQTKPQYETFPVSSFLSVRSAGARGDGRTDDTNAIQNAITSAAASGQIVFFDHGYYKVSNTIYVPAGSRIVGESYAVILASGSLWSSATNPVPVVRVGKSGEAGSVQWSDMVVSTQGSAPGAVLIEYNLNTARGSGVWDVHTRVGGFAGSNLQVAQCPTNAAVSNSCLAAYMSVHITSTAIGAYFENTWFWTADHDLDDPTSTQISVFTGRGMLLEASTVWLYGTAVEHHGLYQYQFAYTNTVLAGFMQTETPYWQPNPDAISQPYPLNSALNDPNYASTCLRPGNCDSLGLRILNSNTIFVYGGGFYSFFNNYSTTCSNNGGPENCQSEMVSIEGSNNVKIYSLSTVGSQSMIKVNGASVASYSDNLNVFPDTIARFVTNN